MIKRETYLQKLRLFQDKPLIKVITGMRRTGKSTLLALFTEDLVHRGIPAQQIIRINFESMEFDAIQDYRQLYRFIHEKESGLPHAYLMLDEVQQVDHWEKAVNSLYMEGKTDIYLTGSNAKLLSSEISTFLSGRYVEIPVYPLSFQEYTSALPPDTSPVEAFRRYVKYGGLPIIPSLPQTDEVISLFLSGVYNTVTMKDIIQRNAVRDPDLLDALAHFLADNIGNPISTHKISGYLTSAGRKATSQTIDNYIRMLEDSYLFHRARRYDIKGKLYLKTQEKYYIADTGLRNLLLGFRNADYGRILENIVYNELLCRGCQVSVGRIGPLEIDFIAETAETKTYYQVSASILDKTTRDRELAPLQRVNDNYEKIILTMDQPVYTDYNGIIVKNIIDFLLQDKDR